MQTLAPLVKTCVSLLVVVNPVGAVPIFLSLTHADTPEHRKAMARTAGFATLLILLVAAMGGKAILALFGISLNSFKVAGGILFLLMGVDMLNARPSRSRQTPEEEQEAEARKEIAIVPIAIPNLAGPGAIGSVILFADQGPLWPQSLYVFGIILVVSLVSWIVLRSASPIGKVMGKTGLNIMIRIMGLLLVAVAVEEMVSGLKSLWIK